MDVKLHNIAINNLRRRKVKVFFLVMGLMVGVAAIVALLTTTRLMEEDIAYKMDEFGANIVITPKTEGLSLTYGGLNLGGVSF
ncbi:MAG: ABC transporter permease, partial [Desulfomonile sp.]|nr:ABC transporter permease [Desulfomonile sp.]